MSDWSIVRSSAGNYHLMPTDNVWANDTVIEEITGTEDEAKELYQDFQRENTPTFC